MSNRSTRSYGAYFNGPPSPSVCVPDFNLRFMAVNPSGPEAGMKCRVFTRGKKFEVFDCVIRIAKVFVVNNKPLRYLSKVLFPNKPVKELSFAVNEQKKVSVRSTHSRPEPLDVLYDQRVAVFMVPCPMFFAKGLGVVGVTAPLHGAYFHTDKCFYKPIGVQGKW